MTPRCPRARPHLRNDLPQRGFSSALMLAVIVLLSSLLAYAVTLTSSAHSGLAQEIAATRALQAARSGLEWGRYRIVNGPSTTRLFTSFFSASSPLESNTASRK